MKDVPKAIEAVRKIEFRHAWMNANLPTWGWADDPRVQTEHGDFHAFRFMEFVGSVNHVVVSQTRERQVRGTRTMVLQVEF